MDDQRRKSVYKVNGQTKLTRYYLGDYEEEHSSDGNIRKIHYLSGAIYIDNSNYNDSLYYVYTDNQGSVIALTDDAGNVKRRFAYDPWGKRRNPQNWNLTDDLAGLIINRGYTGHEHLDTFGIINMNGRVYDPLTAQFFSPDPFIQAPDNWVNYNRYGYVFGNPLLYTDPTGYVSKFSEFFIDNWKPVVTTVATIGVGALVFVATGGTGAAVAAKVAAGIYAAMASSATSGALGTALNGGSFGDCLIAGTKGAIFGGMSAMTAVGIGDIIDKIGLIAKSKFLTEAARAGAHSVSQGAIAVFRGGDFWQGAASGALGSIGVSIYGGDNLWITMAIGSVSGGAGAVIGGAETAEEILFGMATGAIVGALNGWMHNETKKNKNEIYAKETAEQDNNYNFFYKDNMTDRALRYAADNIDDGGASAMTIVINTHGSSSYIEAPTLNGKMTAKELHKYLLDNNKLYQRSVYDGKIIIVKLAACNTGNGFAQQFRSLNPNMIVTAPTKIVWNILGKNFGGNYVDF